MRPSIRLFNAATENLKRTALYDLHLEYGARMVPYAGWSMPAVYKDLGVGPSTVHTRKECSLFDVSHMLQTRIWGKDRVKLLERLTPAALASLPLQSSVLSVFLTKNGGIVDDTILNNQEKYFYVVSNAGCADKDLAYLNGWIKDLGGDCKLEILNDFSLLALQGPKAAHVLASVSKVDLSKFAFMTTRRVKIDDVDCLVSRSGYTGEDGFEIQIPSTSASHIAQILLKNSSVKWAGLGARDALRLEAGMCLYGNDMDETKTPVEAGLSWVIGKQRRADGGFLGAEKILEQLRTGPQVRRVGLVLTEQGSAPARPHYQVLSSEPGERIGEITSGQPSPCLGKNIAMAYVKTGHHKQGTQILVNARDKKVKAQITKMPFVETKYFKV